MEKSVPHFFKEIKERSKLQFVPFNDLYFVYMFFFILIIGGIGIWTSIFQEINNEKFEMKNISLSIGTYFLALISTSYIDLTTNEKIQNKKSLQVYSFVLFVVLLCFFITSLFLTSYYSLFFSIVGVLITLFIWHLANCDNEKFYDESYSSKMKTETKETHGKSW